MRSTRSTRPSVKVSRSEIRRAVASSTAIETGQSVDSLERKLKNGVRRQGRQVKLAVRKTR
jgi:hypothetical protein